MFARHLSVVTIFILETPRTPGATRTDTLYPYKTLFRSPGVEQARGQLVAVAAQALGGVEVVAGACDEGDRAMSGVDQVPHHLARTTVVVDAQDRKSTRLHSSH